MRRFALGDAAVVSLLAMSASLVAKELAHAPAPVDNPLKGLVPYVASSGKERFPHSMEFRYFQWRELMPGAGEFEWGPLEGVLDEVKGRGNQLVFRVTTEYPGKGNQVPAFLQDAGVTVTRWTDDKGTVNFTPDYADPRLRKAMREFIAAMGARYDGDPRIGFITAGMLGKWGEWHCHPRQDLWASKEVQREVMDAYEKAFTTTRVLLRYPAGPETDRHAANAGRPFGYHDDSFGWATLDTGRQEDSWFFEPSMKAAGATDKWKRYPIGGEIRPELWRRSFTADRHPRDQGFVRCVERTHASWLMDTGLFDLRIPMDEARKATALRAVARLGYELHVSKAEWADGMLTFTVENRGVAPFYYDWPVEVECGRKTVRPSWTLSEVLPGAPVRWTMRLAEPIGVRMRAGNPMKGGRPLRFANEAQGEEWLVIDL